MSLRTVGLFVLLPAFVCPQEPTGAIRGTVIDELKSVPLHTANVELRGEGIRRVVQSGATGYRITGLPAGVYDLTVAGSFLRPATIRSVRLKPGETRQLPPLQVMSDIVSCGDRYPLFFRPLDRVDTGKGGLAGTIVDDHGRPLPGARVSLGIRAAVTDDQGRFFLGDIPARERSDLEIAHDGYYTETFTDFRVQAGYEAVFGSEHLVACDRDRCDPVLRPVRPIKGCG